MSKTPSPDHGVSALPMQVNIALQQPSYNRARANTVTTKQPTKEKRVDPGSIPPLYASMQCLVQQMLHSDHGVPIRSYKRRLISAVPSAFSGTDMVVWIMKNLTTESKAEAVHLGSMLIRHGYFFCVEGFGVQLRDDNTLYRFQTPYYWPSQMPSTSDFDYGVFLVKQVLRSKHRIRLLDYELNNLHKLKLRLAKEWRIITEKAEMDVKIFREQKRVAKSIIGSQEEAFWRLHRPPPGESTVGDSLLCRHSTEKPQWHPRERSVRSLTMDVEFLKAYSKKPRVHMSTALEGMATFCQKYAEFDPMLSSPQPGNPWILGDDTLWTMERSFQELPTERQVNKWACSFLDLLTDVTGRYRFEQFCKAQFCSENIRFWQACRDLKSIPYSAIQGSVKLIYDEFLQHGATSEVNVSANVQEDIDKDLHKPTRYAFSAAQEQIFQLMQNDIYPRFIKSAEYQELLKLAKEQGIGGKGFFSIFKGQSYSRRNKLPLTQPLDFTTPCLPDRYARRQLSISRRISSGRSSGSLDDLYLGLSSNGPKPEPKRRSAYTEAFIDALVTPNAEKMDEKLRHRRVSAPTASGRVAGIRREGSLEDVFEEETHVIQSILEPGMSMSYSADDLKQLQEDADLIGPSKFSRFGATEMLQDGNLLAVNGGMSISRSIPFKLSDQKNELLQVPNFGLSTSPRVDIGFSTSPKGQSFEAESLIQGKKMFSSNESVNSASSVS